MKVTFLRNRDESKGKIITSDIPDNSKYCTLLKIANLKMQTNFGNCSVKSITNLYNLH